MKNNTYFGRQHVFRWLLLCWLLVPWVLQAQAQITWTEEVGCQEFRGEKEGQIPDNGIASSYINSAQCLRVCEKSIDPVKYLVQGSNVSNVQWSVSGGTATISGTGNTLAYVTWGAAGNGSLQAVITYNDGTVETQTICIEKINRPIAKFELLNLDYTVCNNTTVYFDNLSEQNGGSDIVNYFWQFGDGTTSTSTAFEPSHIYTNPGNYTIQLTVTNKCGCQSRYRKEIKVVKSYPVQINCASVVCEGSTEKYNAQDGCNKGQWKVIGGNIINNNGNEIEVVWDQVDPLDGFGYVMYMSECACPEWTTVKIPVILKNAKVKGQDKVCAGKQYTYSIPQWPTTKVNWNVSGPGTGLLVNTQQRNEIVFSATQPGTYHLEATYYNTLLACEGNASIDITVEQPVTISGGTDEICAGTSQTFTATPNVPVIWKVTTGGSTVTSGVVSGPFSYTFNTAGTYTIVAVKQGGDCESNPRIIKVLPIPQPPTGTISGETKVCPGKPYVYTISSVDPGMVPVWSVTNGTIQGSNAGSSVTVIFNTGASSYSVSAQNKSMSNAGCLSAPISFSVAPLDLNTITVNPNPGGPFCPSSTQTFTANLNGIVPDFMEWTFGSPNFGSVVGGQGTSNITVNFNEISTTSSTMLNLRVVKCGVTKIISVPVSLLPLPVVSFTNVGGICLGSNLTFSVNQGSITSATGVTFTFANGNTYNTTYNPSGNYSFPNNGYIQNGSGSNVSQTVTVTYTGTNGCNYKPTASANFTIYPETIITVSPVYNILVCDPTTMTPYTLTANSSTGLTNIISWQWFQNNSPISGATTNSYTIGGAGAFGTYRVQAVDINGCVVSSQNINVSQLCPSSGTCNTDPQINFTAAWSGCNTISASGLTYNGTPDQIEWSSDNVLTLTSPQGQPTATYQTTLAGAHIVFVRLRYGSCWYSKAVEVRKNYEPKFSVSTVCSGGGYNVTLFNSSTIFEINQSSITYTFTSPGQPTQTGQTATYNNLAPGTYTFTMTMSAPGKPACTTTQTITLAPVPSTSFLVPAWLCVREPITFTAPGYNSANTYTWLFDGTAYVASGATATVTYNTSGAKTIQLKVTTPTGCVYTSPIANISLNEASIDGNISPVNVLACAGSVPTLVFNGSVGTASQYIWMNGSQPVPGAPNSMTFTPTQSGTYWPVLVSPDGCKTSIMSTKPATVTVKNAPYVNISGKATICAGSSTILTGLVTDNTLEYQWKKAGSVVIPWTSAPYPITLNTGSLAAGTYVYTLEVRTPGTSGCVSSKNFTLTVSNPPSSITATYSLVSCQPYKIQLTASGPSTGNYNWSNGMSGQTITVNEGGVFQVTYTAPSGCKVSSSVEVPLSLESLMWVFPTGCYDECLREKNYIIGPKGVFDHHDWMLFGNSIQTGNNNFIFPLYIGSPGTYQLQVNHLGCQYTSGTMNYYPGKDCGYETDCKIEGDIKPMKWVGDHYSVSGIIHNAGGQPISLNVSSVNGYGTYIPSIITIPAGGVYDLNANPLAFYPNPNFQGTDEVLFYNETCKFSTKAVDPEWIGMRSASRSVTAAAVSSLKMIPNPAKEKVKISYNTGNEKLLAKQITVFDAMGNVKFRKEVKAASGEVDVEVSSWLQGVYIVIVQTGDTSLQGKLIKN
ncbi:MULTISPECIES: PKD domain-containing protein [unclassified Chryseobacterium]|uniref:PKD domain-containing protein n=1 Tax=unclassified Chryseobacterium TaxID=2593645 RepID=UPI000D70D322|nr:MULTISPECIES: PKD domain-containing protein [unclassified Chryseobacterium]PWW20123.1 putative secreted protein (Por secretion system target) [Chryseobacterium sp. AG844]